jgi:glycosyltransferase involved in cell wall biosynthesis
MNPNRGGVQRVSDTLAKYLVNKGHKLFYLSHNFDANDNYPFPATIYHLPNNVFFSDSNLDYYHKLLNELSIDIIINHDSSNSRSKFWLNSGKRPIKRVSLYHTDPLHGINQFKGLSRYFGNKYSGTSLFKSFSIVFRYFKILRKKKEIRFLLKNSERLVFLSDEFKKQIFNVLKISSSRICAISNPLVSSTYRNSFIKKKQILFVARFELSVKRHDQILKVWSIIHNKCLDWELIFLGDGPDRTIVEDMARYLNLKNVRFEGFVNPDPYYSDASIICMTSDYEGFGLVLLEAMQYGVVPIAFNNWVSLKDIIVDEVTGILAASGDLSDYSKKLEKLILNDIFRNHLAENAMEYVKKFQVEEIGPKWLTLFNELLEV